jgi:hypothetical protein
MSIVQVLQYLGCLCLQLRKGLLLLFDFIPNTSILIFGAILSQQILHLTVDQRLFPLKVLLQLYLLKMFSKPLVMPLLVLAVLVGELEVP